MGEVLSSCRESAPSERQTSLVSVSAEFCVPLFGWIVRLLDFSIVSSPDFL